MLTSPFFRRLFVPYLMLACGAAAIIGFVGAGHIRAAYLERTQNGLEDNLALAEEWLRPDLRAGGGATLARDVAKLAALTQARATLIDAAGAVLADSAADAAGMENHSQRPEILAASARGVGVGLRHSKTLDQDLLYVARKMSGADDAVYYLRLAVPAAELSRHLRQLYGGIAAAAGLTIVGAAAACYYLARRATLPLTELRGFAQAVAGGDLSRRLLRQGEGETGIVAGAMNSMAEALERTLSETASDRARLLAILAAMNEGVVAVDAQRRVLLVNAAAGALLDGHDGAVGSYLWQFVSNESILREVERVLQGRESETFQVGPVGGRSLEVTVRPFGSAKTAEGVVIVVHDATESVRYQELRKDFVANVSHELRTPLTAIKGYAETLIDGAIADPVRAPKYVATIEKHADQLTNLVNDLLDLSQLESHTDRPPSSPIDIGLTVRKAAELLAPAAAKKRHELTVKMNPHRSPILGNADYLERAVANLIDNAVKYTPESGKICVSVTEEADSMIVEVTDDGIGVPQADQPRIFERFYRVDRSRSRDMGGTGLGLSIVKHIVQTHGGTIDVRSKPGEGSTFRFKLPLASKPA